MASIVVATVGSVGRRRTNGRCAIGGSTPGSAIRRVPVDSSANRGARYWTTRYWTISIATPRNPAAVDSTNAGTVKSSAAVAAPTTTSQCRIRN